MVNRTETETALTIGNFDGVHRGHAKLVQTARKAVGAAGQVVVLSFDPHPLSVLLAQKSTSRVPQRLTSFQQLCELLKQAGADRVVALKPTREFLSQTASDFITSIVQSYQPKAIIEGQDFRFGKHRAGSVDTLHQYGETHGFRTVVVESLRATLDDHSTTVISSSVIRWLLQRGRVRDAARLLGRPYELPGTVVRGDQRGRTIGIPTVNLDHGDLMLPKDGIYAGTAVRDGHTYQAAISVGTKPTFGTSPRVCEAHLLDYEGPLDDYNWPIRVTFHHWLRDQLAYCNVQNLQEQIARDVARTRREVPRSATATT